MRVVPHASHLVIYDRNVEVARHERLIAKGSRRLDPDPCPEALIRKPRAFPGATATGTGRSRQVHPGPRRLVGPGPQGPWRAGLHPGVDRGPAAALSCSALFTGLTLRCKAWDSQDAPSRRLSRRSMGGRSVVEWVTRQ
ncbi:hypothetical protein ACWGI0_05945 [Streptomyces sp. NPDC054802]